MLVERLDASGAVLAKRRCEGHSPAAVFRLFDHTKTSDKSYKGKLLEVIGVIHRVGTDPILNAPEVMLSGGVTNQDRGIDCTFDTRYASQIAKLHRVRRRPCWASVTALL